MFYNVIKTRAKKEKKKMTHFSEKNRRKRKWCYHNDLCSGKGIVFPVKLKLEGESFKKLKKKKIEFLKRSKEFN